MERSDDPESWAQHLDLADAVVQIGADSQAGFLDAAEKELLPALRAA